MNSDKTKVMIYTHNYIPMCGGIGNYIDNLANDITMKGVDTIVLATKYSTDSTLFDKKQIYQIIRTFNIENNAWRNIFLGFLYLVYYIVKFRPLYLFSADPEGQLVCSMVSIFFPVRILLHLGGPEIVFYSEDWKNEKSVSKKIRGVLKYFLYKNILSRSIKIFVVSKFVKSKLAFFGVQQSKIAVSYPDINNKFLLKPDEKSIERIKERLGLVDKKVILSVARIHEAKGQDIVIKCLPDVIKSIRNVCYLIIGEGYYENKLRHLIKKIGVENNVIMLGHISTECIIPYYDICDVFVMLSIKIKNVEEGSGTVFFEAAARGKASIGSRVGGIPEMVIDRETGLIVDPENKSEIARSIVQLLKNDELARKYSSNAQKRYFDMTTEKKPEVTFICNMLNHD